MRRSNVLIASGHDPSGGAGVQADIEAVAAQGAHAASVITVLTRQDTRNVYAAQAIDDAFFVACLTTLGEDMRFDAIKTGVLGSPAQVAALAAFKDRLPAVPLVVDPVLVASGGGRLAEDPVARALREQLCPRATLITPNLAEARRLCDGEPDPDACGARLAALGCGVLITGGDQGDREVVNHFYGPAGERRSYRWPRRPGVFHGSGCTLAAAVGARLALGDSLAEALMTAQRYTARCLERAFAAGSGQPIPDRFAGPSA